MTTENPFPWADGMNCAVTVCDTEGVILYMNEKARATYILSLIHISEPTRP